MLKKFGAKVLEVASKIAILAWFGYVVATVCLIAKWMTDFLFSDGSEC